MLRNSVSVDMKVYTLQLKQKFATGVFHRILRLFRPALSRIVFGGCFWKENREGQGHAVTLVVSGFHFFQGSYLLSRET